MSQPKIPNKLRTFINEQKWIFAKTYAKTFPHEYIVLSATNEAGFDMLADYIEEHGYFKLFFKTAYQYCNIDGYKYWRIKNIINREPIKEEDKEEGIARENL